jgi:hypothetical protein
MQRSQKLQLQRDRSMLNSIQPPPPPTHTHNPVQALGQHTPLSGHAIHGVRQLIAPAAAASRHPLKFKKMSGHAIPLNPQKNEPSGSSK